jgi:putative transposase
VTALQELGVSERAACRIARRSQSVAQYKLRRVDDPRLVERLTSLAHERRRFGCRRLTLMLRHEGFVVNHTRVHRNYRAQELGLRPRRKRGVRSLHGNVISPVSSPTSAGRSISCTTC